MSLYKPNDSSNFGFLSRPPHAPLLFALASAAEHHLAADPNTCLLKLRQFGEAVARQLCAVAGIDDTGGGRQLDRLAELQRRDFVDRDIAELLHLLRRHGNAAAHDFAGERRDALAALRVARQVAVWLHRAFGGADASFRPGPFVEPTVVDYAAQAARLERELAETRARFAEDVAAAARQRDEVDAIRRSIAVVAEERGIWEQLARDEEAQRHELQRQFEARLAAIQSEAAAADAAKRNALSAAIAAATRRLELDETETRLLIDAQLRDAGWETDSARLRHAAGVRPEPGRNLAIAEWPTASGPADYVLFRGLVPLAVVEAKKQATDVAGAVEQAERYSLDFAVDAACRMPHPDGWLADAALPTRRYRIPFVFATNGRGYHRQVRAMSGVWFRDVRRPVNHADALPAWHGPDGLQRLLEQDADAAVERLSAEPFGYLNLRDYQVRAVQAVEQAIAGGRRQILVAMATGTGKTRTVVGLAYRLLKAGRFHRILFLVDRGALGIQAQNAFKDARLEQDQAFTEIYGLKELGDAVPDSATRVHVATVQGMVRRLFDAGPGGLPVDRYDCIVVDEAHRGYVLDREMGDAEMEFRSERDYVSAYRRVLDQFDAVKIGLTATPAQHTVEIFGLPVFTYRYSEAVVDGWLVDHEPPIRLRTKLAAAGIHFAAGDTVQLFDADGSARRETLPDELDFDVEDFNRLVITENFNRVVCAELAKLLDPMSPQKTLVFCANDAHADLVVGLLREALEAEHGPVHDKTVLKITGRADRPQERIRLFRNDALPRIAVTVDLLTTGIDVPSVCNLVFLRRVKSRILYEQMLGRATRLCPDIGKESFRIVDAVDLYAALQPVNTMRPVVVDPAVPLRQLLAELLDEASAQRVTGTDPGGASITHADDVRAQLVVRLRGLVRRASRLADKRPPVAEALQALERLTGIAPADLPERFKAMDSAQARQFVASHGESLLQFAAIGGISLGLARVISTHADEIEEVRQDWGRYERPEDYLDAFAAFIGENRNRIAALQVVLTRPRDLTRGQLRELQLALAEQQFTDRVLHAAWKQARNEDIAATIIGYVRRMALGSPLVPYATRVERALDRMLAAREWNAPQRRWLQRIAQTLKDSVVVDESTFEAGAWATHGGLRSMDRVFDGQVMDVVGDFEDEIWRDVA